MDVAHEMRVPDFRDIWDNMPEDVLQTWAVYLNMRRLEHSKQDYAMAQLTAVVANLMRDSKSPAARVDDMLIKFLTPEEADRLQNDRDMAFFRSLDQYR